jgi:hypothetical protein
MPASTSLLRQRDTIIARAHGVSMAWAAPNVGQKWSYPRGSKDGAYQRGGVRRLESRMWLASLGQCFRVAKPLSRVEKSEQTRKGT